MKRETWKINPKEEVLTPEILRANPDKYGGLSMHMLSSIEKGIVTIPLTNGSCVVSIPVPAEAADRIVRDGGIDIETDIYWVSITDKRIKRFFKGTTEEIPILTTFLSE